MNDDQTLGDTSGTEATSPASEPFGTPNAMHTHATPDPVSRVLSMSELLESARRPRTIATICMRADLQSEHDRIIEELSELIDADGKVLVDDDDSLAESAAARAQGLASDLQSVKDQMRASMRQVVFEGMSSDDWAVFTEANYPKKDGANLVPFNTKLISAASVEPALSEDDVKQLRKVLGNAQMATLKNKAWEACTLGGLDVPKSSASLLNLARS